MKTHNIIIKVLAAALALTAFTSCQEKLRIGFAKGEAVKFSVGTAGSSTDTKAAYSGKGTETIERIDWQEGDLIRIYCAAVSEPEEKYADYVVTEVSTTGNEISKAKIGHTSPGELGLRWGTGGHIFYGVYPSPEEDGSVTAGISISPYQYGGTKSSVAKTIAGPIVTAKLPATQAVVGSIDNDTAAPDLKNMLMTAKSAEYSPETGITDEVFLSFTPLTTAVQFTITNQTEDDLTLTSVSLTSASSALNGKFTVNIDNASIPASIDLDGDGSKTGAKDIIYSRKYPECTYAGSVSVVTRTVTINFASPVTLSYDADKTKSGKLTFTFFLQPCQDFDDLTFKLTKSDNSWMSTRLGYTDGSGVLFPRFKKTTVTGLLVPKGAQWTVKYGPAGEDATDAVTVATSWDEGVNTDLPLTPLPVVHEYVDLGLSVLWATCNVGATNPEEYGDYFAWGATEPLYEPGHAQDNPIPWKPGKENGYIWDNAPYRNGSSWTKYTKRDEILEPVDDAASVNWGDDWRMPTEDEWKELLNNSNTAWVATTVNGVAGWKVTSNKTGYTDQSIFIPKAGYFSNPNISQNISISDKGGKAYYWSSTRSSGDDYAQELNGKDGTNNHYRACGQPIRAVKARPTK